MRVMILFMCGHVLLPGYNAACAPYKLNAKAFDLCLSYKHYIILQPHKQCTSRSGIANIYIISE